MNAIAMFRENQNPSDEEIKEYLAGNLCRCSGYEGQLRGIRAYMDYRQSIAAEEAELAAQNISEVI
jgi:carbon-monoxide dehydrogenase small subunit